MKNGKNRGLYIDILKNKEHRKLLFSNLINRFGDSVESIAFTWIVYQITHSAAWSAIVFALNILPNVFVQPFAGAIVEKMNKKLVVIVTHFLRAALISLFVFLYRADVVNPLILSIFTLLITTIESFNLPADTAFTAQIIKKEDINAGINCTPSKMKVILLAIKAMTLSCLKDYEKMKRTIDEAYAIAKKI